MILKKNNLLYNLPLIFLITISSLVQNYDFFIDRFIVKFFFIMQISYWIHCFPELYFQKVKKVCSKMKNILCEK